LPFGSGRSSTVGVLINGFENKKVEVKDTELKKIDAIKKAKYFYLA